MLTTINQYKKFVYESLSKDRSMNFKQKQLEESAKQLIDAMKKLDIAQVARKQQNEVVKNVLEELNTHSITCQGVLIQMVNGFESSTTNMKDYNKFVSESVDILGDQYIEMHNKITLLSTENKPDTTYIKTLKNTKSLPNGIVKEGIIDGIKKGFNTIVSSIKSFLSKSKVEVQEIQNELDLYVSKNDQETDHFVPYYNEAKKTRALNYTNGSDLFYITIENGLYYALNDSNGKMIDIIGALEPKNILLKKHNLKLVPKMQQTFITVNESIENDPNSQAIANALIEAKKLIEQTEEEKYYEELVKSKKTEIIKLLQEFDAKKYAIDDKMLTLVTLTGGPKMSDAEYISKMSNAEEVGEHVADMAQSLFSLYTKTFQVSGSLRQYSDDTNLPDGTLGATFDYVFNTVIPPDNNVTESISNFITRSIRKIKSFISRFKMASKRFDFALNQI